MPKKRENWTPYGLEAIRQQTIRRRRNLALAMFLVYIVGYTVFILLTTTANLSVGDGSGGSVELDLSGRNVEERQKPVTVRVGPGRITLADFGGEAATTPPTAPPPPGVEAINWRGELMAYGPPIALLWLLLAAIRSKDKNGEVNYGVYKGAMPYEMITAEAKGHVFTTRLAKGSLFGRTRSDHLPAQLLREPEESSDEGRPVG
ncbi:MAG TPA: hypothetical protein VM889_02990 [Candidatus Thermoplasmatota archaeon]|nr:hypothetical protein [Candidatus Thermoplasmatota archaeon]